MYGSSMLSNKNYIWDWLSDVTIICVTFVIFYYNLHGNFHHFFIIKKNSIFGDIVVIVILYHESIYSTVGHLLSTF